MPVSPSSHRRCLHLWAGLLVAVVLSACQTRGDFRPLSSELPPPPVFVPAPDGCQPEGARFALGRYVTAPLLEEMRMRAGARTARTAAATDAPLSEDTQRLTVDVEPNGRIASLRCG